VIRTDFLRVATAALALSALSFTAGIAGDLARPEPPNAGVRVVLRLPPELPPPVLTATDAAAAPTPDAMEDAAALDPKSGEDA
jgi:hypothetical protein